jgi:ankyrin repeat protein
MHYLFLITAIVASSLDASHIHIKAQLGKNIDITLNARMYQALKEGQEDLDALTVLFSGDKKPDINDQNYFSASRTPLMKTVRWCAPDSYSFSLVQALIRFGADVNVQDCNGDTALMIAAREAGDLKERQQPLVELLIENYADADIQNGSYNGTALYLASSPKIKVAIEKALQKRAEQEANIAQEVKKAFPVVLAKIIAQYGNENVPQDLPEDKTSAEEAFGASRAGA